MNGLSFLITITKREDAEALVSFLEERNIAAIFSVLCHGTAGPKILDLLGIEKTEKMLTFFVLDHDKAQMVLSDMVAVFGINVPGKGIALRVPMSSIGGASSMRYLLENQNYIIGEVANVEEKKTFPYELIVAISEKGYSDLVMAAAHAAGAGGGTVIHAKAAGTDYSEKFFGVSISSEKEVIMIAIGRKDKDAIMRAIMERAGHKSPAHTALFSLPVGGIVGLTSLMKHSDEEEKAE